MKSGLSLFLAGLCSTMLQAATITTTFSGANRYDGNMFNVITGDNDLVISAIDLNLEAGMWNVELWSRPGSYDGFERIASEWTLLDHGMVTSSGVGSATHFDHDDFTILGNSSIGLYLTLTQAAGAMAHGNSFEPRDTVLVENEDLAITNGLSLRYPFAEGPLGPNPTLGEILKIGRFRAEWNGTVHYDVVPEPGVAFLLGLSACTIVTRRTRRGD